MNKILTGVIALGAVVLCVILYNLYNNCLTNSEEFNSDIFKILLEVGLMGMLAVLIKYLADEYTRKKLQRGEQLSGLLDRRLDSYIELWKLTAFCNCTSKENNCSELEESQSGDEKLRCRRKIKQGHIYESFRNWYLNKGKGFYLSHKSKSIYSSIKKLELGNLKYDLLIKNNDMDKLLSSLRSSLKYDCGIYDESELLKKNE